ncbi:hypothetical protein RP726_05695 [Candidatus Methylospira mobilis]|uniref:hypothetical protein n=1 Tax=Candidatus Methylospira mobilis TaxID=1808979 RepID=UPI0028EE743E|nr:hypothetical protein [Candidatus Methylospira mobilis]WNV05905.1 hypothetical protein RP726_05695 [Candidatus Methylospira mobilis]
MIIYDTHKHYKAFLDAGFTHQQAEGLVYAIYDVAQEIKRSSARLEPVKSIESKRIIS